MERKVRRALRSHPRSAPYLFILPFFLLFIPFGAGAIIMALLMSFADWPIGGAINFAGLDNYTSALSDPVFRRSLWNTTWMVVAYMALLLPLALAVAAVLNGRQIRGRKGFQVAFFLPATASLVVVALTFDLLYDERVGFIGGVLEGMGLPAVPFLSDPSIAPWAILGLRIWRVLGYFAVILFAGMQSIPHELYEAARIDGAGGIAQFWYITLPLLRPVTLFVAIAASIGAWELFAEPQILTDGGPARSTSTAVMFIYRTSFLEFDLGGGAAASVLLAVCIIATTAILTSVLRSRDV